MIMDKMLTNEKLNTFYILNDYDCLEDENIYTNNFTAELSGLIFITDEHPFIYFLAGFAHLNNDDLSDIIRHGYYHNETKSVKFYLKRPYKYGSWIYYAWKKFCKNDNVNIYIYSDNCSNLYLSDEYEPDKTIFYKEYIKLLLDEL